MYYQLTCRDRDGNEWYPSKTSAGYELMECPPQEPLPRWDLVETHLIIAAFSHMSQLTTWQLTVHHTS